MFIKLFNLFLTNALRTTNAAKNCLRTKMNKDLIRLSAAHRQSVIPFSSWCFGAALSCSLIIRYCQWTGWKNVQFANLSVWWKAAETFSCPPVSVHPCFELLLTLWMKGNFGLLQIVGKWLIFRRFRMTNHMVVRSVSQTENASDFYDCGRHILRDVICYQFVDIEWDKTPLAELTCVCCRTCCLIVAHLICGSDENSHRLLLIANRNNCDFDLVLLRMANIHSTQWCIGISLCDWITVSNYIIVDLFISIRDNIRALSCPFQCRS